jgi:hypothetical protein
VHISATVRYDADIAEVTSMLADTAFVDAKVRASGALAQDVAIVGAAGRAFTITTRRQVPTTDIPAQFRALVGSSLEVRQVEAWEAPDAGNERRGTIVVEIVGAPVRLTGTLRLVGEGGSTTEHIDGELRASVPLFAAIVEEATADAVRAALAAEERAAAAWLTR